MNSEHDLNRLQYRPHLKWMYWSMNALAALFGGGLLVVALLALARGNTGGALIFLAIGAFFAGLFWLEARFLMKPLAYAFVDLHADRFVLNRLGCLFGRFNFNLFKIPDLTKPFVVNKNRQRNRCLFFERKIEGSNSEA